MATRRRNDEPWIKRILEVVQNKPGINQDDLARAIGMKPTIGKPGATHRNPELKRLLRILEEREQVEIRPQKHPRTDPNLIFPFGYEIPKPEKPVYQCPEWLRCKTYTVPLNELHNYIPKKRA